MAGRIDNKLHQRDLRTRNGPQLRQTKLVLRVTAKRLTYNTKSTILGNQQTSPYQNVNLSESFLTSQPEIDGQQNSKNIDTVKEDESFSVQCKDPILAPTGKAISRPKRNVFQKRTEACGLSWKEETELKKALYASLQRKKIKSELSNVSNSGTIESDFNTSDDLVNGNKTSFSNLDSQSLEKFPRASRLENKKTKDSPSVHFNRGRNSSLYRAQRKFACSSKPGNGSLVNRRRFTKKVDCSVQDNPQNIPYTEDLIDYLCLRGTPFLPENLKFFDEILCRNAETHLETPSSCSSADLVSPIEAAARKSGGRGARRKYTGARKSSGLKNKEFTNAEKSPKVDCKRLPLDVSEKHRPLTRSLSKKESFHGMDSGQASDVGMVSSDHSEADSSANRESGDDDDAYGSEGLSEVLSCFVKDDGNHHMFFNEDPISYRDDDNDDDDNNDDDDGSGNDGQSEWACGDQHFSEEGCDAFPQSSHSDDKLDPADGCCMEQCLEIDTNHKDYECEALFDESGEDDDESECTSFCLELMTDEAGEVARNASSIIHKMSCDANNIEIGTCIGAVNKCIGTDADDFMNNPILESGLTFPSDFPIDKILSHRDQININMGGLSLTDLNGCVLSVTQSLPNTHSSFKCIIPPSSKTIHETQVLLANVPVVSMTSLASVLMIPPMQNVGVNFIQLASSPSVFSSWHGGGHMYNNDASSVLLTHPAKGFCSSTVELPSKEALVDGLPSLRKIAPKISTEIPVASSSLEFKMYCHSPDPCCADQNMQLIEGALTCASDSPLVQQNKRVRGFYRRRMNWKRVTKDLPSNLSETTMEAPLHKELNEPQFSSVINLRSGKVVDMEEQGRMQNDINNNSKTECLEFLIPSDREMSNNEDSMVKRNSPLKKMFYLGRHKMVRKRRKRRKGIELIDRSWNHSGVKINVADPCERGRTMRPVTRSRTLASLDNELMKAKMELDNVDDDDEDDYEDDDF